MSEREGATMKQGQDGRPLQSCFFRFLCVVVCVSALAASASKAAGPQPFDAADRAATLAATPVTDTTYLVHLESRVFLPQKRADLAGTGREKVFVQFERTLRGDEVAALEAKGLVVYESLEPFTYLVSVSSSAAAALAQDPLFRGWEPIEASDKVTASLYLDSIPEHAQQPGGQAAVFFRFYDDVPLGDALGVLDSAGVSVSDRSSFLFGSRIQATAKRDQILAACQSPLVRAAFEIPPPFVIHNVQSGTLSNVPVVQAAPYGLTGSGVAVGVWDEGQVRNTHLDLTTRVTNREVVQPISQHSTHVTGTILGSGAGNAAAKGMAPSATGFSFDFNGDVPSEQAGAVALTSDAIALSNNSWGPVLGWRFNLGTCQWTTVGLDAFFGAYIGDSQIWDALVKDKKYVVVKSAGNDASDCGPARTCTGCPSGPISCPPPSATCDGTLGSDGIRYDLLDPIGVAKNVLTVGSVGDASGRAYYSSSGPADDGRIKPEIVADGGDLSVDNGVTSTCSASDASYCAEQGTSMAAPVVSGIVALIDQVWKNLHSQRSPALNKPTPELVKALLINTAADLGRPGPDYIYGFGLAKAKEAIDQLQAPNPAGQSLFISNRVRIGFVSEGELLNYKISTPAGVPTGEIRTTVAWTDVEGSSAAIVRYCNYLDTKVACTSDANCPGAVCMTAPCGAVPCNLKNDIETVMFNVAGTAIIGVPYVPPGVASLTANAGQFVNHVDPVEQIVTADPTGGNFPLHVFGFTVGSGQQRVAVVSNKKLIFFPSNDNFAGARTIPALVPADPLANQCASGEVPCPGTLYPHNTWDSVNYDATDEAGEPLVSLSQAFSVWFKWVAPATGQTVFDTLGADYDSVLGVYTGASLGSLTLVSGNDDFSTTKQSRVTFTANIGTTYYIQVSGYAGGAPDRSMGVFPLNYYQTSACGNGTLEPGETCDDGNTAAGDCCSATCVAAAGGSACSAPGNVCIPGTCNGTGSCVLGAPLVCNDSNLCTNDSCNPVTGCVFANNTAACNDGNACTTADTCGGGVCVGGPPPALPAATSALTMPTKTTLSWTAVLLATGYDVVRGDLGLLRSGGGNFTTATAECLANDQAATTLGYAAVPAPGSGSFFLMRGSNCSGSGTYDTASPDQVGSRDAEVDASGVSCGTSCSRTRCVTGPAFDSGCDSCTAALCGVDPFCCNTAWDSTCVTEVRTQCGSLGCMDSAGTCGHTLCTTGSALTPGCDNPPLNPSCVATICAADSFCCAGGWDGTCVSEVSLCGWHCGVK
jgi:cysteine-rich repeat protein